jgi:hypothetical protein
MQVAVDKPAEADTPGVAAQAGAADRQEEAYFVVEKRERFVYRS